MCKEVSPRLELSYYIRQVIVTINLKSEYNLRVQLLYGAAESTNTNRIHV